MKFSRHYKWIMKVNQLKSTLSQLFEYNIFCISYDDIKDFISNCYDYIVNNITQIKTMYSDNNQLDRFNNATGFIPTPDWLVKRRAIINIRNYDNDCFFKCIYRYFNRDKYHHDYRDISTDVINKFLLSKNIDRSIFANGITTESLINFEKSYKRN
jgi:hypothetical protein